MRNFLLTVAALTAALTCCCQNLELSDEGSSITFKIKNFGLMVDGSFTGLAGTIVFNPNDLSNASLKAQINASSINTGIDMRDNHLKKEEFFDVNTFGTIRFASVKVEKVSDVKYTATGNLTIKKTTKEVKISFTVQQITGGYIFKGAFPLNRRTYHVGGSSMTMADELNVQFTIKALGIKA